MGFVVVVDAGGLQLGMGDEFIDEMLEFVRVRVFEYRIVGGDVVGADVGAEHNGALMVLNYYHKYIKKSAKPLFTGNADNIMKE